MSEKILVIEDTDSLREALCSVLNSEGYQTAGVPTAEEALESLKNEEFSLILSDLMLPGISGLDFLRETKKIAKEVPIVVMTAHGNVVNAVDAMKEGAKDFITKPFDPSTLCQVITEVFGNFPKKHQTKKTEKLLTRNPKMEQVLGHAKKLASLNSPVMLLGESGTGKELLAHYIHSNSQRADFPFVAVNCGSTPEELLESEFFGHLKGAFTGAKETREGLFETANEGSIFLDEIGNMPLQLQVKLLRTLQESEVKKLGSNKTVKVNTRVISATNCDITQAIKDKKFRADLYYRLGVVILEIPPLRERREDIELLANYFVKNHSQQNGSTPLSFTKKGLKTLLDYDWPGNVRELENTIERAMIFHDGPLCKKHFDFNYQPEENPLENKTLHEIAKNAAKAAEVEAIRKALKSTAGNKTKAAKLLGVSYKTLLNKTKSMGI